MINCKKAIQNLGVLIFSSILSIILLEVALFALTHLGYLHLLSVPNYTLATVNDGTWIADINPNFGVWHPAKAIYRHQHRCFDVVYQANSYGARDVERAQATAKPRVVVLGDSFIEGYGVADQQRLTNRLEHLTGMPHLNFGTSGNFGPTQYYLLYQTLAQTFSHTAVMVALLPTNDFFDDDPEFGRSHHPTRYRPYWEGSYPTYRLVYQVDRLADSTFQPKRHVDKSGSESGYELTKMFLRRFSYTYNTFLQTIHVMRGTAEVAVDYDSYAGYYDYTTPQLKRLEYSLEQLIDLAGDKSIIILTMPVEQDFERYQQLGPAPLSTDLEQFSQHHRVDYVDLLPLMYHHTDDWHDYFLNCDAHWNGAGHETAAHYIEAGLRRSLYSE